MKKKLRLGNSDFKNIINSDSYFVDKMNDVEAAGKLKEEAASLY